jgi:hypothetical protein
MIVVMLLLGIELIAYFVLLSRLAGLLRSRKPDLYAAIGGLRAQDFLLLGFTIGDSLISKIERHRTELNDDRELAKLLTATRAVWFTQIPTVVAAVFVLFNR